jgi:hypothetical protein
MPVGRNEAKQLIFKSPCKKDNANFLVRVRCIDELEGLHVTNLGQRIDVRLKLSIVEEVNALRRYQRALGFGRLRIGVGKEPGHEDHDIEANDHDSCHKGNAMLPESTPHQSPLAGHLARSNLVLAAWKCVLPDGYSRHG